MHKADVDVVVIGGGVVGLSCAYSLAKAGRSVVLLERHERTGQETSSHNSGVIHAGIYYDTGSLKAKSCVNGREILINRLLRWDIPHRVCGKLIVATAENEIPIIEKLYDNGLRNGVEGLRLIDQKEIARIEPYIHSVAALHSPGTGVFDVGQYIRTLEAKTISAKADVINDCEFVGLNRDPGRLEIRTKTRGGINASFLVNASGLYSDRVAAICGADGHNIYPCRGEYATVIPKKTGLIRALVYPAPSKISLGTHLTKTVDGELWVGPTARYINDPMDYESNRLPPESFWEAANKLCPVLMRKDLRTGPSGIRPKRYGPNEKPTDFHIDFQKDDPRIIHLVGIESPGLTASPAIGRRVAKMIG